MRTRFDENDQKLIKTKDLGVIYKPLKENEMHKDAHEAARQEFQKEMESRTKDLYAELAEIQKKITEIEEPLHDKICKETAEAGKYDRYIASQEKALHFFGAMDLLSKGVVTKEGAVEVIRLLLGKTPEIREVSHKRGKDIHVWSYGMKYDNMKIYFATDKTSIISAMKSEPSQHPGDMTYNDVWGCKEKVKLSHTYSRQGMTMHEWLDPEKVDWKGMKVTDIIAFCNNAD